MDSVSPVRYFQFTDCQLAYHILGNGPKALLAFHGFGQDSNIFRPLQSTIGHQYTVYAIDLFFHGESQFPAGQVLTKPIWQRLIDAFLREHAIDRFSVIGFSLGGRFALIMAEQYTHQLEQLILIAPDGITKTGWYWLATSSPPGRWLFGVVLRHLSVLSRAGQVLVRLGALHRTVMRFAEVSLATPEQRRQVYVSWTTFRLLTVNISALASLLSRSTVRVRFFTGYFDQILPEHYINPLTKRLHSYELTVLKTGHNRLIELAAHLI